MSELDQAPCGLLRTDDDGRFLRVNARFCQWLGYRADELIGTRRLQDLLTMGARIFHQTHWTPLLRIQGSVSEVKLNFAHADGTAIPMVLNAIRSEEDGRHVHDIAAFVARDRDRYEQELLLARKRIEEAHALASDRALFAEQLIGIVSHDLRNPLGAIALGAETLESLGPTSNEAVVPRIRRSVDRANRLIEDLLDFTAARMGRGVSVEIETIKLHRAAADIVEDLRATYPKRELRHVTSGEGTCQADENRLGQMIGNLVSNAVAYGRPEAPITVTSSLTDTAIELTVHNEGDPIPTALARVMFDPNTRGSAEGNRARSVGLGLFIVREIARAHGGSASVASGADGTTFTIVMPRVLRLPADG